MSNKKIKVMYVVTYYYPMKRPSGILNFVYELCNELSKSIDLVVVTYKYSNAVPYQEKHKGYFIQRCSHPFRLNAAKIIRRSNPDLIVFGSGIVEPLLFSLCFLAFRSLIPNTPIIWQQYNVMRNRFSKVIQLIAPFFERLICTSPDMERFFKRIVPQKVEYIPPGINIAQLDSITPVKKTSKVRIGYFGHFNYQKGPDILLDIFLELNLNNDVELIMAGTGPMRKKLESKAKGRDNIKIYGFLPNVRAYIKSCDIVVFPYRSFVSVLGFPLTIIEAMAMYKPVMVSDVLSAKSLIKDGVNGIIFKNEKQLKERIKTLISNSSIRKKIGVQARKKAEEFDIKVIAQRTIELWEKVAK